MFQLRKMFRAIELRYDSRTLPIAHVLQFRFFKLHVGRDWDFSTCMWVKTEIFPVACGMHLRFFFQLHVSCKWKFSSSMWVVTENFPVACGSQLIFFLVVYESRLRIFQYHVCRNWEFPSIMWVLLVACGSQLRFFRCIGVVTEIYCCKRRNRYLLQSHVVRNWDFLVAKGVMNFFPIPCMSQLRFFLFACGSQLGFLSYMWVVTEIFYCTRM